MDDKQLAALTAAFGLPSVAHDDETVDGLYEGSLVQVFQAIGGGVFVAIYEPSKNADVVLPVNEALRLVALILRECTKAQS
jgi:hypothetical protein